MWISTRDACIISLDFHAKIYRYVGCLKNVANPDSGGFSREMGNHRLSWRTAILPNSEFLGDNTAGKNDSSRNSNYYRINRLDGRAHCRGQSQYSKIFSTRRWLTSPDFIFDIRFEYLAGMGFVCRDW